MGISTHDNSILINPPEGFEKNSTVMFSPQSTSTNSVIYRIDLDQVLEISVFALPDTAQIIVHWLKIISTEELPSGCGCVDLSVTTTTTIQYDKTLNQSTFSIASDDAIKYFGMRGFFYFEIVSTDLTPPDTYLAETYVEATIVPMPKHTLPSQILGA